jgi:hypothetical protein
MTKPNPTQKTKAIERKRISEALLADRLGLNEEWIERWEERGEIREALHIPNRLPAFIHKNYEQGEIEEIGREVERLVKAGCHRRAVYFCLAQLSPEAIWLRAGGERKPVFRNRQKDVVADADYFVDDERRLGTREHLEAVANTAKAARKQIHEYQRELLLVAESSNYPLPVGFDGRAKTALEALDLLQDSLTWVVTLAHAYTAPMETTLLKSKGLIYLTLYVSVFADSRKLHGSRISSVHRDGSRPSETVRARDIEYVAGHPLTNLVTVLVGQGRKQDEEGDVKAWSVSDLHRKLADFKEDHPKLYKRLADKLRELHRFTAQ